MCGTAEITRVTQGQQTVGDTEAVPVTAAGDIASITAVTTDGSVSWAQITSGQTSNTVVATKGIDGQGTSWGFWVTDDYGQVTHCY